MAYLLSVGDTLQGTPMSATNTPRSVMNGKPVGQCLLQMGILVQHRSAYVENFGLVMVGGGAVTNEAVVTKDGRTQGS